jgi:hypothetical protein
MLKKGDTMEKDKRSSLRSTIAAIFILALLGALSQAAFAAEKSIKDDEATLISVREEPTGISPISVEVGLGETIIWHNLGSGFIKIIFTSRIGLACAAPVNFYADLLGYYETSKIPHGGTASICLIEEGKYEYEVRRLMKDDSGQQAEQIARATVIVKKK